MLSGVFFHRYNELTVSCIHTKTESHKQHTSARYLTIAAFKGHVEGKLFYLP